MRTRSAHHASLRHGSQATHVLTLTINSAATENTTKMRVKNWLMLGNKFSAKNVLYELKRIGTHQGTCHCDINIARPLPCAL